MRRRIAISVAVLALALTPAAADASSRDAASTHAFLVASYTLLHTAVSTWPSTEQNIHKLNLRLHAECPTAGVGSPENEAEQKLTYEAVGAIWAVGYRTDAASIHAYSRVVGRLTWSNPKITHEAHRLSKGLLEMAALKVPNLCADVRAWHADDFGAMPAGVEPYDRHVEAIDIHEVPQRLFTPSLRPSDRSLRRNVEHLATRFEELEFTHGQVDWIALLEAVGLSE